MASKVVRAFKKTANVIPGVDLDVRKRPPTQNFKLPKITPVDKPVTVKTNKVGKAITLALKKTGARGLEDPADIGRRKILA